MTRLLAVIVCVALWIGMGAVDVLAEQVRYEAEDGLVAFQADVYGAAVSEAAVLDVRYQFFDVSAVADIIYGETEHQRDESIIDAAPGSVYFTGPLGNLRISFSSDVRLRSAFSDDLDEYVGQTQEPYLRNKLPSYDTDFATREQVMRDSLSLLASMGLECTVDAIFSVTRGTYEQSYQEALKYNQSYGEEGGKPVTLPEPVDWADEDIAYILCLQQQYKGVPLFRYHYALPSSRISVSGTNIAMSFGRQGLVRLEIRDPILIVGEKSTERLLTYQEAAKRFSDSRNQIVGPFAFSHVIKRMTLEYVATHKPMVDGDKVDEPFELRPAWIMESVPPDALDASPEYYIVDAVNGEVRGK